MDLITLTLVVYLEEDEDEDDLPRMLPIKDDEAEV